MISYLSIAGWDRKHAKFLLVQEVWNQLVGGRGQSILLDNLRTRTSAGVSLGMGVQKARFMSCKLSVVSDPANSQADGPEVRNIKFDVLLPRTMRKNRQQQRRNTEILRFAQNDLGFVQNDRVKDTASIGSAQKEATVRRVRI